MLFLKLFSVVLPAILVTILPAILNAILTFIPTVILAVILTVILTVKLYAMRSFRQYLIYAAAIPIPINAIPTMTSLKSSFPSVRICAASQ